MIEYALRPVPNETRDRLQPPLLTGDIGPAVLLASLFLLLLSVGPFEITKSRFTECRIIYFI